MSRKKLLAFLFCNLAIALFEAIGLISSFMQVGLNSLMFYTELSNVFLSLTALINIYFALRKLLNKKASIPKAVWSLFHAAVSATTVTFLVVVFVLSWMVGDLFYVLAHGSMLYTHTLCPILAIISFLVFAPKIFSKKDSIRALSFTLAYAAVAITLNILRVWHGPYPFLFVYEQPIWASIAWSIGILLGAWGIARALIISKIKSK